MTIEIKELTKRYKDHVAVDNLSLNIEKGEFFLHYLVKMLRARQQP